MSPLHPGTAPGAAPGVAPGTSTGSAAGGFPSYAVVIAHFNHATTLGACLGAALAQTVAPAAVIVVDDHSSDEQYRAAEQVVAGIGDRRVRLLRLASNRGPSAARNTGWAAAGDAGCGLVAFCDADDAWVPDKMARQLAAMQAAGTRMATGPMLGETRDPRAGLRVLGVRDLLVRNVARTSATVVPCDLPERFDESMRHCEDLKLWIAAIARTGGCVVVAEPVVAPCVKRTWWDGGLSAQQLRMASGEVRAYRDSWRAGLITGPRLVFALSFLAVRVARRWSRIAAWSARESLRGSLAHRG